MNSWDQLGRKFLFLTLTFCFGAFATNVFGQSTLFDSSFHISGGADAAVNAILVQPNGKILVGGAFNVIAGKPNSFLARLENDGQLDESFGTGTDGIVNRLLPLSDGKILVAGAFTNLLGVPRRGLARLLANGVVDPDFDPGTILESDEVRTIAVQPDGKIITASEMEIFHTMITRFSRFETNGELDTTFVRTNTTTFSSIFALLPLNNGMILAGGNEVFERLRADGQVDADLSGLFATNSSVFSLSQLANGNILIGGLLNLSGLNRTEAIAQLTSTDQWDADFDADQFDEPHFKSYARSVLVQPDGKFVVAGNFYDVGGYWRRHLVRLDAQGHVDPCFDPGIGLGGQLGARSLARQDDERILVGGEFDSKMWAGVANLARFLPQGECAATRIYIFPIDERVLVLATCAPGGTNLLQQSTNLIDWETIDTQLIPQAASSLNWLVPATNANAFFRVKKVF